MKFTLEIECDNAAFEGELRNSQLSQILITLGDRLINANAGEGPWGLWDDNGNKVGEGKFDDRC